MDVSCSLDSRPCHRAQTPTFCIEHDAPPEGVYRTTRCVNSAMVLSGSDDLTFQRMNGFVLLDTWEPPCYLGLLGHGFARYSGGA